MKSLSPLIERIEADIMGSDLLHADDTPIRVLDRSLRDKGLGKGVRQGRIWAYVRDQRPWAGASPPGAVYRFAPDWKEAHVLSDLADARGILQADGYKGYAKLYAPEPDGTQRLREAACWAHLRRDVHDFWTSTKSEIAREALDRIGKLYDIERALRPIGIGRKNWLFAGADTGAETLARAMTVIETAKLNGLNPQAYLADILDRIHDHKINRLDELLPWNWSPVASEKGNQAA
jgi:hypothetical protein